MTTTIPPGIASRPRYGTLQPTPAPASLLIADDDGGAALLDLVERAAHPFVDTAEILYAASRPESDSDHSTALQALGCPRLYVGPGIDSMLPRLHRSLQRIRMGTQLYLAGSESLIGRAMRACMQAGIDFQAMQTEHRGTLCRRVQCVHCKGITEQVTTQPAECAHCGLLLLVRDHYSRRIAAFQGVNINAEDPADVPGKEEIFR